MDNAADNLFLSKKKIHESEKNNFDKKNIYFFFIILFVIFI
jgi:hypothetical protein